MSFLKTLALLSVVALTLGAPAPAAAVCTCVTHNTFALEGYGSGPGNPCPGMEAAIFNYLVANQVSCPGQFCAQPTYVPELACRIYRVGWYTTGHVQYGCYEGTGCP
jgi:hypothetical protein